MEEVGQVKLEISKCMIPHMLLQLTGLQNLNNNLSYCLVLVVSGIWTASYSRYVERNNFFFMKQNPDGVMKMKKLKKVLLKTLKESCVTVDEEQFFDMIEKKVGGE